MDSSLLRWGIENSVPENGDAAELHQVAADIAAGRRADLADPGLYEAIMGKPDATLMREAVEAALDESKTEDDRVIALDNLELLVEGIDNANDLQNLGLWPKIISLLTAPSDLVRRHAAWVCGTAVQNNAKSQAAFLNLNPLPTLLALISTTDVPAPAALEVPSIPRSSADTRSRAMYALSGSLKWNPVATELLNNGGGWGWEVIKGGLSDPSIVIRRKTAFLLSTLLLPVPTEPSAASSHALVHSLTVHGLPSTLAASLSPSFAAPGADADEDPASADADYREKAARVLVGLLERGVLAEAERQAFRGVWEAAAKAEDGGAADSFGLAAEEATAVEKLLLA